MSTGDAVDWKARAEKAEAALATARAVMAEEAARRFEAAGYVGHEPGPDGMGIEVPAGNIVRALAPPPAGLCVLPVSTVAKVRSTFIRWKTGLLPLPTAEINEAIAALDAAGGETK